MKIIVRLDENSYINPDPTIVCDELELKIYVIMLVPPQQKAKMCTNLPKKTLLPIHPDTNPFTLPCPISTNPLI